MDPLAPPSSVLVAQYVQWCHQVCPQLPSMCHVIDSSLCSGGQARALTHSLPVTHGNSFCDWLTDWVGGSHMQLCGRDCFSKPCKYIPKFISHMWKAFFHLLGVTVSLSSGYHPQMNGQAEQKIQELGRYLRAYCQVDQYSWSCFLPWA